MSSSHWNSLSLCGCKCLYMWIHAKIETPISRHSNKIPLQWRWNTSFYLYRCDTRIIILLRSWRSNICLYLMCLLRRKFWSYKDVSALLLMEVAFYKKNNLIYVLSLSSHSIKDIIWFPRATLYLQVAKFKIARWVRWGRLLLLFTLWFCPH